MINRTEGVNSIIATNACVLRIALLVHIGQTLPWIDT